MTDLEIAVSRLTTWLRDYGDEKAKSGATSKAFIGDVTMVVVAARECLRKEAEAGMRLFLTQAVTISKYGSDVKVACDGPDDAKVIFEFLANLGAKVDVQLKEKP